MEAKILIQKEKSAVVLFQETNLGESDLSNKKHKIWNGSNMEVVGSRGASRGLYTTWKPKYLQLVSYNKTTH